MVALQRTKVTEREEGGAFGVSFKRLLIAGGMFALMAMGLMQSIGWAGLIVAAIASLTMLVMTAPKDGVQFYLWLARTVDGLATMAVIRDSGGAMRWIAKLLSIRPDQGSLNADAVYDAVYLDDIESPLLEDEWSFLGTFEDLNDNGFQAVDPFVNYRRAGAPSAGGSD